jgi:omega-amidase
MRISIVQSELHWEDPAANRNMFTAKLSVLRHATDLVVLPEMFSTGFTNHVEPLAEPMEGPTMKWLYDTAQNLDAAVTGSFICEVEGNYYNRLIFMRPDGQFEFYDKKHLFSLSGENEYFMSGRKRITVTWRGWQICPMICYDLRFPAWSRNTAGNFVSGHKPYYDLLLFVANWPNKRAHHWKTLLAARAIENQAFVVGVNIVGTDGNGFEYSGDSTVIDYAGHSRVQISDGHADIVTIELSLQDLQGYRKQLPFLADADVFEFKG